jgi:hypothetical protein
MTSNTIAEAVSPNSERSTDPEAATDVATITGPSPSASSISGDNFNDNEASAAAAANDVNHNGRTTPDEEGKGSISMQELIYGASSFHAIIKPVCITMILAAVAEIYINTDETKAQGEQALAKSYQVFEISDDQSAVTSIGLGLFNSLVIVAVIGCLTFVIVLLYKYRCVSVCFIGSLIHFVFICSTRPSLIASLFYLYVLDIPPRIKDENPNRIHGHCIDDATCISRRTNVRRCHQQI